MDSLLQKVTNAVRQAGQIILDSKLEPKQVIQKSVANYVTQIDLKVQNYLVNELHTLLPNSNIITEESGNNKFSLENPTWILDPVDGTTNLMRDYRRSAVSLAFFNHQQPVFGIVYDPFDDEMFTGIVGEGSFRNDKLIRVSNHANMKDCLIAFGTTPYQREQASRTFRITQNVFMKSLEIRRSGAAALDIVDVACGRVDGFYEYSLQPWDYAAGMIILQEAGGQITNWQGELLPVLNSSSVLATNGLIHKEILEIMKADERDQELEVGS